METSVFGALRCLEFAGCVVLQACVVRASGRAGRRAVGKVLGEEKKREREREKVEGRSVEKGMNRQNEDVCEKRESEQEKRKEEKKTIK